MIRIIDFGMSDEVNEGRHEPSLAGTRENRR
jgi:hypothetical protein